MAAVDPVTWGQHKQAFNNFIDDFGEGRYADALGDMMSKGQRRLVININDVRTHDPELARGILDRPSEHLPAFEEALSEIVANKDPKFFLTAAADGGASAANAASSTQMYVGVDGSFGAQAVSPRGLLCHLLNHLVSVEGIVTKCTAVHPKVVRTVHYCEATGLHSEREYRDLAAMTGLPTGSSYPTKDAEGRLLSTEYGLCVYRDHQVVTIQEMPERAPPGQLPRSVEVLVENELVDQCRPGDRLRVAGVYRAMPAKASTTGMFRTRLLANFVRVLSKEASMPTYKQGDIKNIKALAKNEGKLVAEMSRSLAPSVYGHEDIKKALLLQLLGGVEKNLPNGTHLRGDINVLMVGDPSTAKSQILRFAMHIAPLHISTTGRGSSGVGLTAAVTTDSESGERRLEAGAMVLADRGLCCIDEFDKMLEADRVAIHEVMEQQTITIAKAGLHASLNARTSVLAAANPVYGKYDRERSVMENIGLPDSLLSRFDLLFIVLDDGKAELDRAISGHVLQMHRTSKTGATPAALAAFGSRGADVLADGDDDDGDADPDAPTPMYVKFERGSLQVGAGGRRGRGRTVQQVLSTGFIKKYVHYAKQRCSPVMTGEACDQIGAEYATMRQRAVGTETRCLPVTPRSLETLIRLSTAHAKLRLSAHVEPKDVDAALELLNGALFKDLPKIEKKKKKKGGAGGGEEDEDGDDGDDGAKPQDKAAPTPRSAKRARGARGGEEAEAEEEEEEEEEGGDEGVAPADGAEDEAEATRPLQPDEEPVPLSELPAGFIGRVHAALGALAAGDVRNENEFSLAVVFGAVADVCAGDEVAPPKMGELKAALGSEELATVCMYDEVSGIVHVM